ncbi:Alpha-galactosidase [Dactylellina cionopaga]|nr:Alpha-galactosidase [Dactylellina cionopaga]
MDYEEVDAKTFADWGVDYLKYDNCFIPDEEEDKYPWAPEWWNTTHDGNKVHAPEDYDFSTSRSSERYRIMRDALKKQDRVIQFGMCNWGHAHVEQWGNQTAQSWRIRPTNRKHLLVPILNHALFHLSQTDFWGHADMDMLEVGNGLSEAEDRSHFALWAILKSPLLIGTPLDKITPAALSVFKNKELIAYNQDSVFGTPAKPYKWGLNPDWTWYDSQKEFYGAIY